MMLDIIRIAICDDEKGFLKELSGVLNSYANEFHIDMGIYEFEDGFTLLKDLENRKQNKFNIYDIIILDYEMYSMINGLEVAKMIKLYDYSSDVVFLTKYKHFMREAFKVNPSRFLLKPLNKIELFDYLHSYIKIQRKNKQILLEDNGELIRIKSSDIMYFKADDQRCFIYMKDRTVHCWKTLSKVLDLMPNHYFRRVHRSYAINMDYIKSLDGNKINIINGECITIAKKNIPQFKKDYKIFVDNFKQ